MLVSQGRARRRALGRDLLAAAAAGRDPRAPTTDGDGSYSACSTAWPRSTSCTSTTSAPRRRADVGARAALRDRQRPLRGGALDRHHDQPRARRRSPSRSPSGRCRAWRRCARRARSTATDARAGSSPQTASLTTRAAMPGIVIVGAQWGDEGKGKIADLLAEQADMVVRFQGGNNAGHTIVRDGREVEVPPDPERDPLPRQAVRDRQRRRRRPARAHRRDRRAARAGASTSAACASAPTRT